ncbi:PREDICTED: ribosomal RNA processing protein 36 homolog isoform X2 [Tarenaya hassleriana]|nr:PREDICTED: ribosomal RNA processing protein 36 homolog isoform X2 [Tarenaya hassleriana]XP_010553495.1 PREDICTED: ribosomal RNA processing protein 36 homolog isoform X2 [Tarenaya hassleriana]
MKKADKFAPSSSKVVFDDSEEEEEELSSSSASSSDEEKEIEHELTFEEMQRLRADGSKAVSFKPNQEKKEKKGRANKNRPMEVSCKRPVSRFRDVVQAPKKVVRDPRFESLCGNLDTEGFRKRYDFLFMEKLPAEREELKRQLRNESDPEVVGDLENRIRWIDKMLKPDTTKSKEAAILTGHKKKEREAAKQGKKPYYLKKSDIRKQKLIEKYNDLKASGKLETYLTKKRKKNASKEHRYMPYRRPNSS